MKHDRIVAITFVCAALAVLACVPARGAEDESATVIAGSEVDFPPYAFVDEKGRLAGFSIDLIRAAADTMDLPIVFSTGSWESRWNGLVAGNLDALPIVAKVPERRGLVDFSVPHTETFDAFFVRKGRAPFRSIADARGKTVIVMDSDAAHHELLDLGFQGRLITVDSIPEGLSLISSGRYDAFLCPKLIGTMVIKKNGIRGVVAGPPIPDYKREFAFAVKKGDAELLEKLNQGLFIVKTNGQYEEIYDRWLTADVPLQKMKRYVIAAAVAAGAVALISGIWLLMVHALIRKRTRELAEKNELLRRARDELERRVEERTEALRRIVQRLELLSDTADQLLHASDHQQLVESVCRKVMDHLDCHVFFNFLAGENAGKLRLFACAGIPEEEARKIEWVDYGVTICGCVVRDARRIVAEHIPATADPRTEHVRSFGIRAYACHPLLTEGGGVIGTLSFGTRSRETFTEDELSLMKAVTCQLAIAMVRLRSKEALESLVTERTRQLLKAHRELERSRRMADIGRLSATVAHEIRNPLSAIRTAAYNIRKKAQGPALDKHLATINKKIFESDNIIQNLLSFTRIRSASFEPVRIRETLRDCIGTVSSKYAGWGIVLKEDLWCGEDDVIEADPAQVKMLFNNILDNAYQALPEKTGTISVAARKNTRAGWEIAVADTGVGMDAEDLEKIYEPFFTTKSKGTGLGLAVSREIVDMHGGKIEVNSFKGKGTTFTVTLPQHPPRQSIS